MPARVAPLKPVGVIARYIVLGAGLGMLVGVLWVNLAPRVLVVHGEAGRFVEAYPQGFAIADLTLGSLLLGVGVVLGVLAMVRLVRTGFQQGWAQIAGVVAGALVCAAVARVFGWWIAGREMIRVGDEVELPLTVQANGVLVLGAFSALLVVLLGAAFARDDVPDAEFMDLTTAQPPTGSGG